MVGRKGGYAGHDLDDSGGQDFTNLIIQREQARLAKDFSTADHLRMQLKQMGVEVYDKTSTWEASDGRRGRVPSFTEVENGVVPNSLVTNAPGSSNETKLAQIKQMVNQREQARSDRDFDTSDMIREQLKMQGVELYDKEKLWRTNDGHSGVIIGFHAAGPSDVEITTLVSQREKVRQAGDYATADMIRDELKVHGVEIYDKEKRWTSKDGRQGQVPSFAGAQMSIQTTASRGHGGSIGGGRGIGAASIRGGGGGGSRDLERENALLRQLLSQQMGIGAGVGGGNGRGRGKGGAIGARPIRTVRAGPY